MKKLCLLLTCIILSFTSCSNDSAIDDNESINFSLISPDNTVIASSAKQLNAMLTNGKGTVTSIEYTKTNNKTALIAKIDYQINNVSMSTFLVRGIENFKFPNDAVLKIDSKPNLTKSSNQEDIYIYRVPEAAAVTQVEPMTRTRNY